MERRFIGGGKPREEKLIAAQELAQRAAAVERQLQVARKTENYLLTRELEAEHKRLMEEQREIAKKAAEAKEYKLKG